MAGHTEQKQKRPGGVKRTTGGRRTVFARDQERQARVRKRAAARALRFKNQGRVDPLLRKKAGQGPTAAQKKAAAIKKRKSGSAADARKPSLKAKAREKAKTEARFKRKPKNKVLVKKKKPIKPIAAGARHSKTGTKTSSSIRSKPSPSRVTSRADKTFKDS